MMFFLDLQSEFDQKQKTGYWQNCIENRTKPCRRPHPGATTKQNLAQIRPVSSSNRFSKCEMPGTAADSCSVELRASNTMEEELRCPACKQFYNNPVLLPCFHALCLHCAVHLQQPATNNNASATAASSVSSAASSENAESVASGSSGGDYQESDKLSILSETDSGVVCTSRPNSYVGTPNGLLFPTALSLACPICNKLVYFDENGAYNLPKYRVMQSVVDKYGEAKNLTLKCQLCENEPANDATVLCEQCEVLYCDNCRESCHPARGPLAKHNLSTPKRGVHLGNKLRDGKCPEHVDENLNMFCLVCKIAICPVCLMDTRHASHDVQALVLMCKAQKVCTLILLLKSTRNILIRIRNKFLLVLHPIYINSSYLTSRTLNMED